jgi:hypothetical protein
VPLLKIFPGNYFMVTWLIESFSWLLLFIVLHQLIRLLTSSYFWANAFVLFSGFFLYNVELSSSSKDVLATMLIFYSLLRCLRIMEKKQNTSSVYLAVSALVFILPGLTKYIYIPLTIVFPFTLLFIYFLNREKPLLRAALVTGSLSIVLLALHFFFFRYLEANAIREHATFYTNRWSLAKSGDDFIHGFFPGNLLLLYPYLPAGVFNLDVGGVWVRSFMPSVYKLYGSLLYILNVIGIASLAAAFIYTCKKYFHKFISLRLAFFICGTIISFSMLFLVSALSLRYHTIEYKGSISAWTYVFENRPFIFSIIFLQLILVVFLFSKKQKTILLSRLSAALLVIMLISGVHGLYYLVKTSINPAGSKPRTLSINKLVIRDATQIAKANKDYRIWIGTEMQHLDWYAKLQDQKLLNHLAYLNDSSFKLPHKTILVTVIPKEDTLKINPYLHSNKIDSAWNYDRTWFIYMQKQD